ncbi:hypothetical protein ITJ38_09655 [Agreia pratensis]|uniref:DUF6966 domain-containing protein n=1 Tax=Agreia pratensis TaxID=150121 RepID=UPI001889DD28|nr:hypothetical protein [Agreia pratensis]MBF4634665.1 hypothetical protein [Agreia pratensis]
MNNSRRTVASVRGEIVSAIAEVRAVAKTEGDKAREDASDWLDELLIDVDDRQGLREASARGLSLYRGGMGSFQDAGSAASAHAISRLRVALRRGRSWFLRGGHRRP